MPWLKNTINGKAIKRFKTVKNKARMFKVAMDKADLPNLRFCKKGHTLDLRRCASPIFLLIFRPPRPRFITQLRAWLSKEVST